MHSMESIVKQVARFWGVLLLGCLLSASAHAFEPFVVEDIRVEGLQRITAGTVFNYLPVKLGQTIDTDDSIEAVKALFRTGFFNDVYLERDGNVLVVYVEERAAISSIEIEGNKDLDTEELPSGQKLAIGRCGAGDRVLKKGGVARNMPVITDRGLVGRVTAVGPNSAQVLLLIDPASG